MVSEWMRNGSINEYVKAEIDVDRLELVCSPLRVLILAFH